jgi:hypothetical protein
LTEVDLCTKSGRNVFSGYVLISTMKRKAKYRYHIAAVFWFRILQNKFKKILYFQLSKLNIGVSGSYIKRHYSSYQHRSQFVFMLVQLIAGK